MIEMEGSRARHCLGGTSIVVALLVATMPAAAEQPTSAQASAIRSACRGDYQANCSGVPTGGAAALQCLQQNAAKTSPACQSALQAVSGGAPKAAPTPRSPPPQGAAPGTPPAQGAAADPSQGTWPHTIAGNGGIATVYQPQVISWPERRTLKSCMHRFARP